MRENLHDLGLGKTILDVTKKKSIIHSKKKKDKLDFINMKNFCSVKDTIKKVKNQVMYLKYLQVTYVTQNLYPEYVKNTLIKQQENKLLN